MVKPVCFRGLTDVCELEPLMFGTYVVLPSLIYYFSNLIKGPCKMKLKSVFIDLFMLRYLKVKPQEMCYSQLVTLTIRQL